MVEAGVAEGGIVPPVVLVYAMLTRGASALVAARADLATRVEGAGGGEVGEELDVVGVEEEGGGLAMPSRRGSVIEVVTADSATSNEVRVNDSREVAGVIELNEELATLSRQVKYIVGNNMICEGAYFIHVGILVGDFTGA